MFLDVLGNSWVADGQKYLFPMFYICSLKCMGFSFAKQVYLLDFGLNQDSRKGKDSKNVALIWTGGWTLR